MPIVNQTATLVAGAQRGVENILLAQGPVYKAQQEAMFHYLPYTNIRSATFPIYDSLPTYSAWPYNTKRTRKVFQDRYLTCGIIPFQMSIPMSIYDSLDNQMGKDSLQSYISGSAYRLLQLPDRIASEYLIGTAVELESILNAYDGAALYYATDGAGDNRYGVSGGNILSGQNSANAAGVTAAIIACKKRYLDMTDSWGEPLYSAEDVVYSNMTFVVPSALDGIFNSIAEQDLIYSESGIRTAQSNMLKTKIKYHVNQRLSTATTWYVFLNSPSNPLFKALAIRAPQDVEQLWANPGNSDEARENNTMIYYGSARIGAAPLMPAATIEVTA